MPNIRIHKLLFPKTLQWQYCADKVLNLGVWHGARTHSHVLAWHTGSDYSNCIAP